MRKRKDLFQDLDWLTIGFYLFFIVLGWLTIYSTDYTEANRSIFDSDMNYGKQFIWIVTSIVLASCILLIDSKFYTTFSYAIYGVSILLLASVLVIGKEVGGNKAWIQIGSFSLQPAEFAKFTSGLVLAKYLSGLNINIRKIKTQLICVAFLVLPMGLTLLQGDTGSALVFSAFILVLFREGMHARYLIVGVIVLFLSVIALVISKLAIVIGLLIVAAGLAYYLRKNKKAIIFTAVLLIIASAYVYSVDYAFNTLLRPHQRQRVNVLLGKEIDIKDAGYNVWQSKIAIGSGGVTGKGYMHGSLTKYDFVPEQSTDFIFCSISEEHGFIGSSVLVILFVLFLLRLVFIAERQRSKFGRIYGYGVASVFFFHLLINVGMTIGLVPVIGIPFPFVSYGGSSMWAFTMLLFILLKLDSDRLMVLR